MKSSESYIEPTLLRNVVIFFWFLLATATAVPAELIVCCRQVLGHAGLELFRVRAAEVTQSFAVAEKLATHSEIIAEIQVDILP